MEEEPRTKIQIMPIMYIETDKTTDFSWMAQQPQYAATLFIYNDNQQNFVNFLNTPIRDLISGKVNYSKGSGNAKAMRPYQYMYPIRAMGIPLGPRPGHGGGYKILNKKNRDTIDMSFKVIEDLLSTGLYDTIAYSAASDGYTIGTSTFTLPENIVGYVTEKIWSLGS